MCKHKCFTSTQKTLTMDNLGCESGSLKTHAGASQHCFLSHAASLLSLWTVKCYCLSKLWQKKRKYLNIADHQWERNIIARQKSAGQRPLAQYAQSLSTLDANTLPVIILQLKPPKATFPHLFSISDYALGLKTSVFYRAATIFQG